MRWEKQSILRELRSLHSRGRDLSYNAMAAANQKLVSAGAYHFGSYRAAVEKAGLDYAMILKRPRWTRKRIIGLIKTARRAERELHWSAVTRRGDELSRAAFASVQKRLFGGWDRALHAAGLDADEICCYRTWDRNTVAFELRSRKVDRESLSSGDLQKEDPSLHAAAVRYFGSYPAALRAAGVAPDSVRHRKRWDRATVLAGLRKVLRKRGPRGNLASGASIRRTDPKLHAAAVRLFGSIVKAMRAATRRPDRSSSPGLPGFP